MHIIDVSVQGPEILVQQVHGVQDLFVGDVLIATEMDDVENDGNGDQHIPVSTFGTVGDQALDLLLVFGLALQIGRVRCDQLFAHLIGPAFEILGRGRHGQEASGQAE